ncbi:EMB8 [Symbiodinium microadriaticum]|nr:EMB8 [Symbiodinium microadriaticum]
MFQSDQRVRGGDEESTYDARCTSSSFATFPEGDKAVQPSLQAQVSGPTEADGEKTDSPTRSLATTPDLASFVTSFDDLDATLMRGIPLRQTLQWGAHLWLSDPRSMGACKKATLWDASKPTKRYDKFLSHTWETFGRWKLLSLLLGFGWPSMMIFWAIGATIGSVLVVLEVLPLFTVFGVLWCVFELAAYRKLNPNGRIVISRIMTEVAVLLTFIWAQLGTVGFWLAREGPHGGELWRLLLVVVCVGWRVLAAMALAAVQKQDADEKLRSLLTNFDVMNAKCSNEFDRQCIHDLITTWYGSHYLIFLLLPNTGYFLEGFLAFWMSEVPAEISISYFLAVVLCLNLTWLPSVVVLGAYLTQQGIRLGRCRITPSLLEPLLICVLCILLLAVGISATIAAVFRGVEMSILWNIVGLVFAAVVWMSALFYTAHIVEGI